MNDDFFYLAPPLVSKKGYGFAVIQIGLDFSETMILRLTEWSPLMYVDFWRNELLALLDGTRTKGVIACGVSRHSSGRVYNTSRWNVFRVGNEIVFHDVPVIFEDDAWYQSWKVPPEEWWTLVEDYTRDESIPEDERESEWRVGVDAVRAWCHKYGCVLSQMENTDSDDDFNW